MINKLRLTLILIGLIFILVFVNSQTRALNKITEEGELVLLELVPVDPRAFMQGDFMELGYAQNIFPKTAGRWSEGLENENGLIELPPSGMAILSRDQNNIGTFSRIAHTCEAEGREVCIRFIRKFDGEADYGGARYFFQEGTAEAFEAAEYGVFRVNGEGRTVLVGLAGADFKQIIPD